MYFDNFVVMTNTKMCNSSSLNETLNSYAFYNELSSKEWVSALNYSTLEGFDNNLEAMLYYALITLERLEHYEQYEKCKRLNYMIKLYQPVVKQT
jgi:hypothetical protein